MSQTKAQLIDNLVQALSFTGTSSAPANGVYLSATNQLSFATNTTERLRIDSAGQLEAVSLGSASAPTYSWTTDPDTGMYSPGADQLALATGGTQRLYIGATGRVGINMADPQQSLHVSNSTNYEGIFINGNAAPSVCFNIASSQTVRWRVGISGINNNTFTISKAGNDDKLTVDENGNVAIDLTTLYVDAVNNRVGIGTTAPATALNLGDTSAESGIQLGDGADFTIKRNVASVGVRFNVGSDLNNYQFQIGGDEALRIDSSKRLLVGTSSTSSTALLQVQGNSSSSAGDAIIQLRRGENNASILSGESLGSIQFSNSESTVSAVIEAVADANWNTTNDYPSRLVFSTTADGASSPTERMRITSSGFLKASNTGGYRNATGLYHEFRQSTGGDNALWIDHTATSGGLGGISINYTGQAPNDTSNAFIACGDTSTTRFAVRSNGGVANYSANNVNLSDINTKKDITPANDTWDCLKEWEIVNFRYKDQPDDADLNMGVIAQQVAESCPEVITVFQEAKEATETEPAQEERLGVKDQQMMWMAIKALQEAQLRIETLEAEVAALKGA
jgi:hypothetical protein